MKISWLYWRHHRAVPWIAGAVITLLAWSYLKRERNRLIEGQATSAVIVAAKYIADDALIDPDMVEIIQVPVRHIHRSSLNSLQQLKDPDGRIRYRSRTVFMKGEPLTMTRLIDERNRTRFAWSIPEDRVALSIRLSPEDAVAGLVNPGDNAVVVATFDDSSSRKKSTSTVLARVGILAVGDRWQGKETSGPDRQTLDSESFLVTLALKAEDVQRVALAADSGHIKLALYSSLQVAPVSEGE